MGLKRGHKPPTANPKIRRVPKRTPKKLSRKTIRRQLKKFSKRQLYTMLADAVRNTG